MILNRANFFLFFEDGTKIKIPSEIIPPLQIHTTAFFVILEQWITNAQNLQKNISSKNSWGTSKKIDYARWNPSIHKYRELEKLNVTKNKFEISGLVIWCA